MCQIRLYFACSNQVSGIVRIAFGYYIPRDSNAYSPLSHPTESLRFMTLKLPLLVCEARRILSRPPVNHIRGSVRLVPAPLDHRIYSVICLYCDALVAARLGGASHVTLVNVGLGLGSGVGLG